MNISLFRRERAGYATPSDYTQGRHEVFGEDARVGKTNNISLKIWGECKAA